MAQRMESVAPPGGVMLSESTARLVENAVVLGRSRNGAHQGRRRTGSGAAAAGDRRDRPAAQRLATGRTHMGTQYRHRESSTRPSAVPDVSSGVVGPPGIGKSRLVRETAAIAAGRGVPVFTAYCESTPRDIPFHVVARLLRDDHRDRRTRAPTHARARVRARLPQADPEDLLLLEDLLGIRDPDMPPPDIDPDARRQAVDGADQCGGARPDASRRSYVIEDAHWIDEVSESMIADFLTVIPRTPSLVLITYRPEYRGVLSRVPGAQTHRAASVERCAHAALTTELLGADPSLGHLVD